MRTEGPSLSQFTTELPHYLVNCLIYDDDDVNHEDISTEDDCRDQDDNDSVQSGIGKQEMFDQSPCFRLVSIQTITW